MGTQFEVRASDGQTRAIIQNGTSDPVSGTLGELHYRSDQELLQVYDGTIFRAVQGGSLRIYGEKVNETPNGALTAFTVDNIYVTTTTEVHLNGVLQELGVDYTESNPAGGEITFTTAPLSGAIITVSYSRLEGSGLPLFRQESQEATASQTVFNLGFVYTPGAGNLLVYSSGTLMRVGGSNDYVETDENTITFNTGRTAGEVIQFVKIGAANDQATSGWQDTGTVVTLSTLTDQVQIGTGSAATPSLALTGDADTGMYSSGTDQIGFTAGGVLQLTVGSGNISSKQHHGFIAGTNTTPGIRFDGDTDTGIYSLAADQIGFAANAAFVAGIGAYSGGSGIFPVDGTAAAPAYTFNADTDTGIYRRGANNPAITANGTLIMDWASTGAQLRTGQLFIPDGTAGSPVIAFADDTDTGLFSPANNEIALVGGGTARLTVDGDSIKLGGGVRGNPTAVSVNTSLGNHHIVLASNSITLTLPVAAAHTGRMYFIKNVGTGTITIDGNASETIDGQLTQTLNNQYEALTIVCDGTEWFII